MGKLRPFSIFQFLFPISCPERVDYGGDGTPDVLMIGTPKGAEGEFAAFLPPYDQGMFVRSKRPVDDR